MTCIKFGPSPGMWDGTAGYVVFKAPSPGTFLVVGTFSGYQVTFNMHGPWGTNTAYCPVTSQSAAALALWKAQPGDDLNFTIHFTGPVIGYLESIVILTV
jgi:hypothetical protein